MTKKKKDKELIKYAKSLGIKLKISDKPSGEVLFPEKLAKANEIISRLKNLLPS